MADARKGMAAQESNSGQGMTREEDIKTALESIKVDVKVGSFRGKTLSVWELLHSSYIKEEKRQELLVDYRLTIKEIAAIVTRSIEEMEKKDKEMTDLGLHREDIVHLDEKMTSTIKSLTVDISIGPNKGQKVTVWELLTSKYISAEKRKELLQKFKSGEMTEAELIKTITIIIEETEERSKNLKFKGLRRQVTATELLTSEIIDQKTLTALTQGSKTVEEVTQMDLVKRYLEGTSCIAGVFVPSKKDPFKKEKMSIYQAMRKNYLRPGTALVLLEAQAATGFVIDPLKNTKLSVDEALAAGDIDKSLHPKLLSAERAVTGYTDPYTGQKISLFQAMNKELIVKDHGIRLLEAQIATGGIIDPVHSHRVPVEVAYKRGYFDEEMNQILSDPSDDTKGFFDPNTHENLTYMQLLERCVQDPETGLFMLDVQGKGTKGFAGGITSQSVLQTKYIYITVGHFQGQNVSVWNLLQYYYSSEEERQVILKRYQSGTLTIDELIKDITTTIKEREDKILLQFSNVPNVHSSPDVIKSENIQERLQSKTIDITVGDFKGQTPSLWDLLHSKYFAEHEREEMTEKYKSGTLSFEEIAQTIINIIKKREETRLQESTISGPSEDELKNSKDPIHRALKCITLDINIGDPQLRTKSLWEHLHSKDITVEMRNEQMKNHKATVDRIIQSVIASIENWEIIDGATRQAEGIMNALQSITIDVKAGQYRGQRVTVWDLIHSKDITGEQRKELLNNYKLTVTEITEIVSRTINEKEENNGDLDLQETESCYVDEQLTNTLKSLSVDVSVGLRKGQKVTVWELLNSEYISVEKRKELLQKFKSGEITDAELIKTITIIIQETEERSKKLKFKGLRRQVTASELLNSEIIDQKTLTALTQGSKTVEEVTQMDGVKRYLEGTSCIAGVFVPSKKDPFKKEKMSIYQAMRKNYLRPGTALVLLEAQAATGFVIDPLKNTKLSVDEALAADVIDQSLHPKLLSAERAVTGYRDPYTEQKISLFQAMNKDLIVKDHGIRLLEAQIATGGIIDPVHSHRVPVEVAYKRGYFDEEINQILSDPSDDTKGFFDPNTHENLTYMQLLERCVQDPETGLLMLDVQEKGTRGFAGGTTSQSFLQTKFIYITVGHFQGQNVSVWNLLQYYYSSEEERQAILKRYQSGSLTVDELIANITTSIKEKENQSILEKENGTLTVELDSNMKKAENTQESMQPSKTDSQLHHQEGQLGGQSIENTGPQSNKEDQIDRALKFFQTDITIGELKGQRTTVWDLLHSDSTSTDDRINLLKKHRTRVEEIIQALTTTIEDKEDVEGKKEQNEKVTKTEGSQQESKKEDKSRGEDIEKALRSISVDVKVGQYRGQKVTLWDLLHSKDITEGQRKDLQNNYKLTIREIIDIITHTITEKEKKSKENGGLGLDGNEPFQIDQETTNTFQSLTVDVSVGSYKGQKVTVWELLNSKYISAEKRKELLRKFKSGEITETELIKTITIIIEEMEERSKMLKFKGLRRQVTATELLASEIIDQKTLTELTQGSKTVEEVTQMVGVKRYLEGTSCIAGVFVPSKKDPFKKEKMSIYQAMRKNYLRPGTALVLLEAQAATGFVIDPLKNTKLSVDEALAADVIDQSLHPKLLSAERAVTGYRDPYTEQKISLFQAMNKDLIVKDHGIRLLEAQIATGGVIDPVHSHRVPVEVAYKRGYFDEEMNKILSDPSDDTKGFFDPNTHENLTYMQLLERCVQDPETGLFMLDVQEKGTKGFAGGTTSQSFLQTKFIYITVGHFQGQNVSVWELLKYYYSSEEERQAILKRYQSGSLTIEELIKNITTSVKEKEKQSILLKENGTLTVELDSNVKKAENTQECMQPPKTDSQLHQQEGQLGGQSIENNGTQSNKEDQINRALQFIQTDITIGELQGQRKTVWDLLHSDSTCADERINLLKKHRTRVEEIIQALITTIEHKEDVEGKKEQNEKVTKTEGSQQESKKEDKSRGEDIEKALRSISVDVKVGQYRGQKVTLWDLLHSKDITEGQRKELLNNYNLTIREIIDIVTQTITEKEKKSKENGGLGLDGNEPFQIDEETTNTFKSLTVDVSVGSYKGQKVTVWELLNSKYISAEKRKELLRKFKSGEITENELIKTITIIIEETEERSKKLKFKGLRRQVTATELLASEIIDQKTLTELTQGSKTVEEVTRMVGVKRYLEGTSCIAGVFVPSKKDPFKKEKMSIYQAMRKNYLRPGTALVLLEAQAATGFVIDPLKNTKLSVDEALAADVIDQSLHPKLLSAERAVTGYRDPYTEQKISLFQAMNKDLIVKDHGIRLLEAQIATGGIIDPVHSHRVPVEVAYKRGYFDEEMNQILSDPSDDTKGFFDPNTHENLTYMQLLERCVQDPETGLFMLDVQQKGSKGFAGGTTSQSFLQTKFIYITVGHFQGQNVSVWELLKYYYSSEEERQAILKRYQSGSLTIEELIKNITTSIKEKEKQSILLKENGTLTVELDSNVKKAENTQECMQPPKTDSQLHQQEGQLGGQSIENNGTQSNKEDQINRALQFIQTDITIGELQGQRTTVWDLLHSDSTCADERINLLKKHRTRVEEIIQALITTIEHKEDVEGKKEQNEKVTKTEGSQQESKKEDKSRGEDIEKALRSISVDVKVGQYRGQKVTLWDLLHSKDITEGQRKELLNNYNLTIREIIDIVTQTITEKEKKSKENGGLGLDGNEPFQIDEETTNTFKSLTVDVSVGSYKGQKVTVWELLNSKYISAEKRKELLRKFKSGEITETELIKTITIIIEETEERSKKLKFKGLRRQVTATELLASEIIDQKTLTELTQGSKTVEEVTRMVGVKRYLEGTSCIAGVFVPSKKDPFKKEKMSIYQAMRKNYLRPGTALVLLEAQAATGFVIDPLKNTKLSVDEALAADVIDQSLHPKLLSAERAVTGYRDPYTEQKISLFQAMNKDLIVKDHGIRLLEAQIATGGIIDPVHSHRVPVEVAYKRGYFDEEMNQILSDPSDDTKGFFDPNTHENLTYMQLLERCVQDPETGLFMLDVQQKGSKGFAGGTTSQSFLQTKFIYITVGHFQGQNVSVWELLKYYYSSEEERQAILKRYQSGSLTIEELIKNITTSIKEKEKQSILLKENGTLTVELDSNVKKAENTQECMQPPKTDSQLHQQEGQLGGQSIENNGTQSNKEDQINRALQFIQTDITIGELQGQRTTVWDLLHSDSTCADERINLLKKHRTRVEEIIQALITTIEHKEDVEGKKEQNEKVTKTEGSQQESKKEDKSRGEDIEKALRSISVDVKVGQYRGQKVTLWDLLHSKDITEGQRKELLNNYNLTIREIIDIVTQTITEKEKKSKENGGLGLDGNEPFQIDEETTNTFKSLTVDVSVGSYKGQKVTVWELLNSKYISAEKRKELLRKFKSGEITETELIKTITIIIEETEERSKKLKFKGLRRQVTATELLASEIIDQKTLTELTQGSKTVEEVTRMVGVKRYLEGTSCIAGVFVPSKKDPFKKEKMSIYQAMRKNYLRPGTALVLLEAQAATGFVIDPLKNTKLSVDEALAADVIDQSLHPKLLSAERAVTGYRDPYTEQKISLFQAMNKDLIVKDHGIRLLEAQIATGGIIDPVHSHRVPVEVAYKRGYFDEEMNQILSDPSDDTKGFFDPNTHENLTYMQLLERCVQDPETGLFMLDVQQKGSKGFAGGTTSQSFLQTKFIYITVGHFQGQNVSVWELLKYYYSSEEEGQAILKRYQSGSLTIEELIKNITTSIKEKEKQSILLKENGTLTVELDSNVKKAENTQECMQPPKTDSQLHQQEGQLGGQSIENNGTQSNKEDQINRALQFIQTDITIGELQGQRTTVWDLLHSDSTCADERINLLKKHRTRVEEIIQALITTIEHKEDVEGKKEQNEKVTKTEGSQQESKKEDKSRGEDIEKALRSISVDVKVGQYRGQKVTLWDLLHSKDITEGQRKELLNNYNLTIREIIDIVTQTITEKEKKSKENGGLGLDGNEPFQIDEETTNTFKSLTVDVSVGSYKGQKVTVWELLNSKYISAEKRKELLRKFKSGEITETELIKTITIIIEETEERSKMLKFKGLRRQVTATELLASEIIDQKTLTELTQGSKTVEEVTQMVGVKRYLEGTSCIAGVFVPSKKDPFKKEKMSIYQAMRKNYLRPGTALVLLEAQAATGFVIDPLKNTKLSVDEALAADVIDQSLHPKLLSAERAVTGYRDPYTEQKISLFQAMNKDLIVKDHGIRLLEAQIATGGIIDPVHSHRVPVEVAYKRGYFDEEMNQILSDPSDDTKGFFDPNTHENLTYMQLLERCVQDPETGLFMLDVQQKGSKGFAGGTTSQSFLQTKFIYITVGHFQGQNVSVWELLKYYYSSEEERQAILKRYQSGSLTIEELIKNITTSVKEKEKQSILLKENGTLTVELDSNVKKAENTQECMQPPKTDSQLHQQEGQLGGQSIENNGTQSNKEDQINRALQFIQTDITIGELQGQRTTVWDLLHSDSTCADERINLLKKHRTRVEEIIQALITTIEHKEDAEGKKEQNEKVTKTEGSQQESKKEDKSRGEDIEKALRSISVDVKVGQYRGQKVTLWDLLHSKDITVGQRKELLNNYKLTIREIIDIITHTITEREKKSKENGGLDLDGNEPFQIDEETTNTFMSLIVDVSVGSYKGQKVTVWELLNSKYISAEKRKELLRKFKSGEITETELIKTITIIIEETEERSKMLKFKGLRRQVTATELLASEIIDQKTLTELTQGSKTVEEVTQMVGVKRYLEGTSCIAGVFVPSKKDPFKKEKMSIYQAMRKNYLRPGTALVLLEAQAATGFVIDPLKNTKLSVDEALAADVIDQSLHPKLLSAERAVTGYRDPYTEQKISLFQAMNKDLIVKDHGIRLLEAQIATGGIIDPVHSHRVPVEVAYKRGYFDEEMNQILSDPSDDTKGFFDPNTHENLTYMQLLERCVQDPETGLFMLDVQQKGSKGFAGGTTSQSFLQTKFIYITVGHFQGQNVSVWELLKYYYSSEEERQAILKRYQSGSLTIEELIKNITTSVKEKEKQSILLKENGTLTVELDSNVKKAENTQECMQPPKTDSQLHQQEGQLGGQSIENNGTQSNKEDQINRALQFIQSDITIGELQGQRTTVWDLLHSDSTCADERINLLKKHRTRVEEIIQALITTIEHKEDAEGKKEQNEKVTKTEGSQQESKKEDKSRGEDIEKALRSISVDVKVGQYRGQKVTLWDLLHSKDITVGQRKELLNNYKLTIREIIDIITHTITEREKKSKENGGLDLDGNEPFQIDEETTNFFKSLTVDVSVGSYKGQKVTVWELLNSKYISAEKRKELLRKFKSGEITETELIKTITIIIEETEERSKMLKFKGLRRQVTATELLASEIIDQKTLTELTQGSKTVEEVTQMVGVKRYLEGTSCIAGVFVPSKKDPFKKEKMSIYQAMRKNYLRPGTALVLLEAQAATGFVIDPLKNTKLSVDEALAADVIDQSLHPKLLSAERAVTGYKDPYTEQKISLFQAMNKDLIVKDHGIRLLEAQIATGGIIDPVHSHRVPVEVAYKRGYFDEEINQILSDPSDDTKGFFDPNTHENLTYMQLLERCVQDPETGLFMLDVQQKGSKGFAGGTTSQSFLQTKFIYITVGHFQGQNVSVWNLLQYYYSSEEERQAILKRYQSGSLTIDELIANITTSIKERENHNILQVANVTNENGSPNVSKFGNIQERLQSKTIDVTVGEFKGQTRSLWDLLHSKYYSEHEREELIKKYKSGTLSLEDIAQSIRNNIGKREGAEVINAPKDGIDQALQFINTRMDIGEFQGQTKTVWELLHSKYTKSEEREGLLNKHKTTVNEMENILTSSVGLAEKESGRSDQIQHALQFQTIEVGVGEFSGQKLSVWDLLHSKYISDKKRNELLEQYRSGTLTLEELITIITTFIEESDQLEEQLKNALQDIKVDLTEGPLQGQGLAVWNLLQSQYITENKRHELLKMCRLTVREITANVTSTINEQGGGETCLDFNDALNICPVGDSDSNYLDNETKKILQSTSVEIAVGQFKGRTLSLWEILESSYVSQIKKIELLRSYKTGTLTSDEITRILIKTIEKTEERRSTLIFRGLRREVTAAELLSSEIIDQKTLNELTQGSKTVEDVTQTDSVKRYLEGTSCIAGVLVPLKNNPSKKEKMSIHHAMQKHLLMPGTALVLLEAQAATGFIVDPLENKKLSVDEAVAVGVVGQALHTKLLSAERAVTGYKDPYTGNQISLFQAMKKDLIVKDHGIRLLEAQIATGGIIDPVHSHRVPVEVAYKRGYFDEEMNQILSDPSDDTKGFFDPNTQENLTYMQLLERCVQDPDTGLYMLDIAEKGTSWSQMDKKLQTCMQSTFVPVPAGTFHRKTISVWDLFFSRYITEEKRQELFEKLKSGTLNIDQLTTVLVSTIKGQEHRIISKSSNIESRDPKTETHKQSKGSNNDSTDSGGTGIHVARTENSGHGSQEEHIKNTLKYFTVNIPELQGQTSSLWTLICSKHIPEQRRHILFKQYTSTIEEVIIALTHMLKDTDYEHGSLNLKGPNNGGSLVSVEQSSTLLQAAHLEVTVGEFKGQRLSVWQLLNSKYISEEKKKELLSKFQSGELTIEQLIRIITTIIEETEERSSKLKFKGLRRQVTASELLSSEIIDQKTLTELTQGKKTLVEVTQMDSVKRYLEGSNCIAGVLVASKSDPSKMEKMSIYAAMCKRILRPGTALVLLEAQAATGFMINPVTNEKLSVDEALSALLIGQELHAKLLSAERAVTGYRDPYTGQTISLFQAMNKDLIVKDHGIRLLEAQIATGGIIDPVHSHRVPVEVAYKRGYFDEKMNEILSDPSDDTKGFFDPNTHENLTYMQLLERGIQDPETGLCLLLVTKK
ncbi:epiplakin [Ambystoma mexicanum]|uniref:epiplakin n=1 Tax=Ambystoma mexicanum TaxID=8296 RepID=UPI0037E82D44